MTTGKRRVIFLKNRTVPVDPYEQLFTEAGFSTSFVPLLHHEHLNKDRVCEYLSSSEFLEDTAALIITSQRAVEALDDALRLLRESGHVETAAQILLKPSYTVGPATTVVLQRIGFKDVRGGSEAGNGSILADLIVQDELFSQRPRKVVFFTGETRRDILPKKLLANDFELREEVLYRTVTMDDVAERFDAAYGAPDDKWVVFFSPQGTESITGKFQDLVSQEGGLDARIASIGPTTETHLVGLGLTPHVVARKPDAGSLLASIS